jgi:SAM-dependent methyltransferase
VAESSREGARGGGYVTDVPYARHFAHQLAPSAIRLVAALNGVAPPPADEFTYCEIGSGVGDALVILAASNPRAEFVGIDLNPAHIAASRRLAEEAALPNVRFIEGDLSRLLPDATPALDFIGAHGFLSWVGPSVRRAIVTFAEARLKPGGLLYASYNALPGWAAIEPLRRLLVQRAAAATGSSLDRAREAHRYVRRLAEAGAGYFANHPTAKSMLALIEEAGLPYVVHEYMNAHWEPMYFADVAATMAAGGLHFVGRMPLHLNVPELAIPASLKELAKGAHGREDLETFEDYALNEFFRSDVYARASSGRLDRAEEATRAYFRETRFGAAIAGASPRRTVKLPHCTLDYTGPVYDAVLAAIATAPASAQELASRPELAPLGVKRIGDLLMNLCLGGDVAPMRERALSGAASPSRLRVPIAFNRAVLAEAPSDRPRALASPVTGTGLTLSLFEVLCLQLLTSVEPARQASWIRAFLHKVKGPVTVGQRAISDPAELVRVTQRELEGFRTRVVPKLIELGVVGGDP